MVNTARDQTDAGVRFLDFLATARNHTLAELDQADVDDWFATASNPHSARDFLVFARARRRCPAITIPDSPKRSSRGSSPERLVTLIRKLLDDETIDRRDRVAGLLVVLLAQPVSRISAMSTDDIVDDGTVMELRIGADPIPVPDKLAHLVRRVIAERPAGAGGYLFPGGRPGQHATAAWMSVLLNRLGITRHDRQGALTRLLADVPAAIVARSIGYSLEASTQRSTQAGHSYASYVVLKTVQCR
jgi:hypothetical protein